MIQRLLPDPVGARREFRVQALCGDWTSNALSQTSFGHCDRNAGDARNLVAALSIRPQCPTCNEGVRPWAARARRASLCVRSCAPRSGFTACRRLRL
eukprot:3667246-Prymnesium_polylepis.1